MTRRPLLVFVFAYLHAVVEHLAPSAFFINPTNNPDGVTGGWELLYFTPDPAADRHAAAAAGGSQSPIRTG